MSKGQQAMAVAMMYPEPEDETQGPAGLQRVNRCVFRRLLRADERTDFTLDIDATQIVAEKREARYSYKGEKGY